MRSGGGARGVVSPPRFGRACGHALLVSRPLRWESRYQVHRNEVITVARRRLGAFRALAGNRVLRRVVGGVRAVHPHRVFGVDCHAGLRLQPGRRHDRRPGGAGPAGAGGAAGSGVRRPGGPPFPGGSSGGGLPGAGGWDGRDRGSNRRRYAVGGLRGCGGGFHGCHRDPPGSVDADSVTGGHAGPAPPGPASAPASPSPPSAGTPPCTPWTAGCCRAPPPSKPSCGSPPASATPPSPSTCAPSWAPSTPAPSRWSPPRSPPPTAELRSFPGRPGPLFGCRTHVLAFYRSAGRPGTPPAC